ncbi:MAG: TonB family protein, partial [Myxococcota bacterium]
MLRLAGVLIVLGLFANGVAAQTSPPEPEGGTKPLVVPPKLIRFVEATRPEPSDPEAEPEEVSVELLLTIDKDGQVTEASVADSGGEAYDAAALAAARQFLFEPARQDWEPVPARIRYRYVFTLEAPEVVSDVGWLSGAVLLAENDKPAGRVGVEILSGDGVILREIMTGADGTFIVTDLRPGTYT